MLNTQINLLTLTIFSNELETKYRRMIDAVK
jgi:hypothetical protein